MTIPPIYAFLQMTALALLFLMPGSILIVALYVFYKSLTKKKENTDERKVL